jgi:glycosyltransferase involved in cell wall biosynthesis
MLKPLISLIICTRNRAEQLSRSLKSIEELIFDGAWQLIIVNNGSTDKTESIIREFEKSNSLDITYVYEPAPGLSRARNAGISKSKAEIIAFTDDDCYPAKDFLTNIYMRMSKRDFAFCGGRVLLFDNNDAKITVQEKNESLVIGPNKFLGSGLLIGANLALRKSAIISIGGFDERIGAGTRYAAGEETDVMRRLLNNGMVGFSDPLIVVYHHHGRQRKDEIKGILKNYSKGRGASMVKLLCFSNLPKMQLVKSWYWNLKSQSVYQAYYEILYSLVFLIENRFSRAKIVNHPSESLTITS